MENSFHFIRRQYSSGTLDEKLVDKDPFVQLTNWVNEAISYGCSEPTAMVLSTSGKNLRPSSRVVLMKNLDQSGIAFFTHYESRKGIQLLENPLASLLFFWPQLERQVRIEGSVDKVSGKESDEYFASRPEASRISAAISPQSKEIPDRQWLVDSWQSAVGSGQSAVGSGQLAGGSGQLAVGSGQLAGGRGKGERPGNWGGYRVVPDYFEFWQGREDRLHDRIIYRLSGKDWKIARLAP